LCIFKIIYGIFVKINKNIMALITNYTTKTDEIFETAYIKIQRIDTANIDYEFFKNSDKPDVYQELTWINRIESNMKVFVWVDQGARNNRVAAVDWFTLDFTYDLTSNDNIYTQAYKQLNKIKFNELGINV